MTTKTKKTLKQFIRNLKWLAPLALSITIFTILVCTPLVSNPLIGLAMIISPLLIQLSYLQVKSLWYFSEFEVEMEENEKEFQRN